MSAASSPLTFTDYLKLGRLFSKRLREASAEAVKYTDIFLAFRKLFKSDTVQEMDERISRWNKNPNGMDSPYADVKYGISIVLLCNQHY